MNLLRILAACLVLGGCATQNYYLRYDTKITPDFKIENADPFTFYINPVPNGIIFTVRNNTDQTARIIWDKSYFIMPDGNSYKALNIDILKENSEVAFKSQYISIIPSHALFSRFTTASINTSKIRYQEASAFTYNWQEHNTTTTYFFENDFLLSGAYWTQVINLATDIRTPNKVNEKEVMKSLYSVSNDATRNNKLGLGLVIEHRGVEKEYRFDIKITKIDAIRKVNTAKEGESANMKYFLDYTFDFPSNKWQKVWVELKN